VYRWLDGEPATIDRITDLEHFATGLTGFLAGLGADVTQLRPVVAGRDEDRV
jgi:hypothetical protein